MHRADAGNTRSQLLILSLLLLSISGCSQLIAVTGDVGDVLPEKTPETPAAVAEQPPETEPIAGGEIAGSEYPRVLLSKFHAQWCSREVGDSFPELELTQLGGGKTGFKTLTGKQATVVLFWHEDRWMSQMAVEDIQREVVGKFDTAAVSVIGIPVQMNAQKVRRTLNQADADFPQLLDTNGEALKQVGSVAMPRVYVLDSDSTIVWFDIEFSESTRRELHRTLALLTGEGQ